MYDIDYEDEDYLEEDEATYKLFKGLFKSNNKKEVKKGELGFAVKYFDKNYIKRNLDNPMLLFELKAFFCKIKPVDLDETEQFLYENLLSLVEVITLESEFCKNCGKKLSKSWSKLCGVGPECAKRYLSKYLNKLESLEVIPKFREWDLINQQKKAIQNQIKAFEQEVLKIDAEIKKCNTMIKINKELSEEWRQERVKSAIKTKAKLIAEKELKKKELTKLSKKLEGYN